MNCIQSSSFISSFLPSAKRLSAKHCICTFSNKSSYSLRTKPNYPVASIQTPDSFSTSWYKDSTFSSNLDISTYHIPLSPSSNELDQSITDFHYVDQHNRYIIILDIPNDNNANILSSKQSSQGTQMLTYIKALLNRTDDAPHAKPIRDLRRILASAIANYKPPSGFSALLLESTNSFLRAAWVGACGFLLIRDDIIHHRSYPKHLGRSALEDSLYHSTNVQSNDPTLLPTRPLREDALLDHQSIHYDYVQTQPSDLVIAATDGFFANVTEQQTVAFVRPVPNAEDTTLAIANNTCLGSWRYDDPEFIAYYLASIAANFATATNSAPYLPFPFPPSPHQDDITVACLAFGD